jgi:2-dehydro-3-deoxyphosphogluconate aldolase / (4S)-4-hydroxy-2-oxoglutarate aldolase
MYKPEEILTQIIKQGVLPLYYHEDEQTSLDLLKALYAAGIRSVEYTNRGEAALANFKTMKRLCETELTGMMLGVGTIKNGEMARRFMDAGADYIICPGLVESVAKTVSANSMLWIPGCMTPSEIIASDNLGARLIKLFPGNLLGTDFMKAIKDLFPNLLFMPTGGVDTTKVNIKGWFDAGVSAVGMGSKLISNEVMANKQYDRLTDETRKVMELIQITRA